MCISAGQNGARLIKISREEIGLQPRSKVILRHAQQDFDTISSEVFLFSPFFACQGNLCYQGNGHVDQHQDCGQPVAREREGRGQIDRQADGKTDRQTEEYTKVDRMKTTMAM